jgi:hypothetical protein
MPSKRQTSRSLAALLTAGVLSLALTAGATAVVYVYSNGFHSRADFKEIKRTGGKKKCDKSFGNNAMRASVKGKRLCEFLTPVVGDAPRPNHVVAVKGKVLRKQTAKPLREGAYLAVKLRLGGGDSYELRIRPKGKKFQLLRNPSSGAISEKGRSKAIRPIKDSNKLRLEVKGARVRAFVNGKRLAAVEDPNPEAVGGRKVAFGIGSRKNSNKAVVGRFERIRVGIP